MITKCDMCGSKIIENKCNCGIWVDADIAEKDPYKLAIEKFHESKQFTMTGDAPHLGAAVVFFRGDYNDCKKVEQFIHQLKKRPFYGQT